MGDNIAGAYGPSVADYPATSRADREEFVESG